MASSLGALAAIANYESSSESEEDEAYYETTDEFIQEIILSNIIKEAIRRVEYAKSVKYRNHDPINVYTSSSEADESSSTSSSDEDMTVINSSQIKKRKPPPKVKGELLPCDLPKIEDLHISVPDYECLKVGVVSSIVEEMVVVQADPNTAALDLDTILFLDKGTKPLGRIFDVMGPVMQPFYCVRFNSKEHVQEKQIVKGLPIFYAPRTEHTSFVFLAELVKLKGSAASWENDNEPPSGHLDYSDDEAERKAKRVYAHPSHQERSNNAFYRRDRRYKPHNYGPIQWNSVHTQHLNQGPFQQ